MKRSVIFLVIFWLHLPRFLTVQTAYCQQPADVPPSAVRVSSEADLIAAAKMATGKDLNILVSGFFPITRELPIVAPTRIVRLFGETPGSGFDMSSRKFDGVYPWTATFGLHINARQCSVINLRFAGYDTISQALDLKPVELAEVLHCSFADIGRTQYPFRVTPAQSATDACYNQCIYANATSAHINVIGCKFERCVLNNRSWSHCIYISGSRSFTIDSNTFDGCGNPYSVETTSDGGFNVLGDTIMNPAKVMDRMGTTRPTYIASSVYGGFGAYLANAVSGLHEIPRGTTNSPPERLLIDYCDFSGMAVADFRYWAAVNGVYKSWSEWVAMGFDRHSKPATRPAS